FPAFEERSGMRFGPTEIMRQEHDRMRDLMMVAAQALTIGELDAYCEEIEMMVILMQQHNMKEEHILYPMCDRHFAGDSGPLAGRLAGALAGLEVHS
ncbi:MAG TPA: hemerythrin domain-containing protein, partial [Rhodocyclaceae bacterium]|nr:hemerythrin domain-containing protein [Rhodocyclaceae bacterium]